MSIDWTDYGIYRYDDSATLPQDWQHVLTLGDWGGYDWSTLHAFWSPSARRFFWSGSSGCSCNSWGDDLRSEADFENGSKDDLRRAIRAFAEEYQYSVGAGEAFKALDELAAFKPSKVGQ